MIDPVASTQTLIVQVAKQMAYVMVMVFAASSTMGNDRKRNVHARDHLVMHELHSVLLLLLCKTTSYQQTKIVTAIP
jgi:hypothetical protein